MGKKRKCNKKKDQSVYDHSTTIFNMNGKGASINIVIGTPLEDDDDGRIPMSEDFELSNDGLDEDSLMLLGMYLDDLDDDDDDSKYRINKDLKEVLDAVALDNETYADQVMAVPPENGEVSILEHKLSTLIEICQKLDKAFDNCDISFY